MNERQMNESKNEWKRENGGDSYVYDSYVASEYLV